jgi:Galactose oxidase, central domain
MAYDATAQVVVAVALPAGSNHNETWWLDPASNVWTRSATLAPFDEPSTLVYSPDLEGVLSITRTGSVASFDVAADAWTVRTSESLGDALGVVRAVALDEPSGDIILVEFGTSTKAWRYDAPASAWTEQTLRGVGPTVGKNDAIGVIMVDDPGVDGLVVIAGADVWQLDPTGATSWMPLAPMPQLQFSWGVPRGTEAAYAPSTDRLIVMSGGVTAEYDPATDEWTLYLNGEVTTDPTAQTGVPRKLNHAMVYDPLNDRVLLYGGDTWTGAEWSALEDMWAYAPATHTWQQVLAAPDSGE